MQASKATELDKIWVSVLDILKGQMTHATFDSWLKHTALVALDDKSARVAVRDEQARQWCALRLSQMIIGALCVATERRECAVSFEVDVDASVTHKKSKRKEQVAETTEGDAVQAGDVVVEVFALPTTPFVMVSKYALYYWQPYLGARAFAVLNMLRAQGREYEGTSNRTRISVDVIAKTLDIDRQVITGRWRNIRAAHIWDAGLFDALNASRLASIRRLGEGRAAVYDARVWHDVPLLTPAQVATLDATIQKRHERYLRDFRVDVRAWARIKSESLVLDFDDAARL